MQQATDLTKSKPKLTSVPPSAPNPIRKKERMKQNLIGWAFVAPTVLFVIAFIYYGIFYNAYHSLFSWDGISFEKVYIGFENFGRMFKDPEFYNALKNTGIFTVLTVTIQAGLGLVLAYLLHTKGMGRTFFKSVFFFPVVLSPVVLGAAFTQIFDFQFGYINEFLRMIGLGAFEQNWLGDQDVALYAIILINIFQWTGSSMIMYYMAMLAIEREVFEAANIDGAGFWRTLWSVVFPNLKGTTFTLTILGVIGGLKTFDIVWISTQGGPGNSTEVISTYLFRKSMLHQEVGYASAVAVILLAIALGITYFQMRVQKKMD
ncbi:carbohydrate ABC transporter permease [Exiguobacterium profundum]|uniref:carbohydrate ABC transporter permease n=1 Tax=Exiguobacterium TaxID=33986 RepID=UPI0018DACE3D|nr:MULTISPECIES: sugar ABC transporter permease [Exiguobacterium]MCT4798302.1 sugar ABC transporter permease [Exiguobacterium profundum]MCV9900223.1 sugar ABC transporter permease [Exiguobacterium sp. N5]MDT0192472.1 sugar ABC transporter permease [Exiguobacterium sp. BG5(2022)]QPI68230.1 sugar ABC transporter permease [Exiguobacterium sp. PBE]